MIRRPPRSTPLYSSAASDVYKRQLQYSLHLQRVPQDGGQNRKCAHRQGFSPVSYTHLRAHETKANLVCRLLLEKKKKKKKKQEKTQYCIKNIKKKNKQITQK